MEKIGGRYHFFYADLLRNGNETGYWTGVASAESPEGPWQRDERGRIFDGPDGNRWVSYRIEDRTDERGLLAIDPVKIDKQGELQAEITTGKR